jgi:hypothetical protein
LKADGFQVVFFHTSQLLFFLQENSTSKISSSTYLGTEEKKSFCSKRNAVKNKQNLKSKTKLTCPEILRRKTCIQSDEISNAITQTF